MNKLEEKRERDREAIVLVGIAVVFMAGGIFIGMDFAQASQDSTQLVADCDFSGIEWVEEKHYSSNDGKTPSKVLYTTTEPRPESVSCHFEVTGAVAIIEAVEERLR